MPPRRDHAEGEPGGVHDGRTALKLVAAGASTVQLCSAIYGKGWGVVRAVLEEMESILAERRATEA